MQIKANFIFYFNPITMVNLGKMHTHTDTHTPKHTHASMYVGYSLVVGVKTCTITLETMWRLLKKLNIDILHDLTISPLVIYSKDSIS